MVDDLVEKFGRDKVALVVDQVNLNEPFTLWETLDLGWLVTIGKKRTSISQCFLYSDPSSLHRCLSILRVVCALLSSQSDNPSESNDQVWLEAKHGFTVISWIARGLKG